MKLENYESRLSKFYEAVLTLKQRVNFFEKCGTSFATKLRVYLDSFCSEIDKELDKVEEAKRAKLLTTEQMEASERKLV